jgi:hypothetical protein
VGGSTGSEKLNEVAEGLAVDPAHGDVGVDREVEQEAVELGDVGGREVAIEEGNHGTRPRWACRAMGHGRTGRLHLCRGGSGGNGGHMSTLVDVGTRGDVASQHVEAGDEGRRAGHQLLVSWHAHGVERALTTPAAHPPEVVILGLVDQFRKVLPYIVGGLLAALSLWHGNTISESMPPWPSMSCNEYYN